MRGKSSQINFFEKKRCIKRFEEGICPHFVWSFFLFFSSRFFFFLLLSLITYHQKTSTNVSMFEKKHVGRSPGKPSLWQKSEKRERKLRVSTLAFLLLRLVFLWISGAILLQCWRKTLTSCNKKATSKCPDLRIIFHWSALYFLALTSWFLLLFFSSSFLLTLSAREMITTNAG